MVYKGISANPLVLRAFQIYKGIYINPLGNEYLQGGIHNILVNVVYKEINANHLVK